jgi:group I intron endonuclease
MKKTGIYIITNSVNNKIYIGCSTNIHDRWKRHLRDAFNNNCKMYKYPLYRSIRKYGKDNFSFEILLETFDYFYWEKFFIFWHKSNNSKYGYNLTSGGEGSLGCHHSKSAETRKKLSIINRGKRNKKNSDNLKKGFSNGVYVHPRKGKILTDEQRKRISEGHKGIKIPDYYYCKDLDLKCDSTLTASLILGISRETFRRIIKNQIFENPSSLS